MENMLLKDFKEIFGTISVILAFIAYIPYIRSIILGNTKPHIFSWIIWSISIFIVFLTQIINEGGAIRSY